MANLTMKQRAFVDAYFETFNASEAARKAGYIGNRPNQAGQGFLSMPAVQAAIQSRLALLTAQADEAEKVLLQEVSARGRFVQKIVRQDIGYVYFFRADNDLIKIGLTVNVKQRKRTLETALPYELETVHIFQTSEYEALEGIFHEYFSAKRVRGEWFRLSSDDLARAVQIATEHNATSIEHNGSH